MTCKEGTGVAGDPDPHPAPALAAAKPHDAAFDRNLILFLLFEYLVLVPLIIWAGVRYGWFDLSSLSTPGG